MILEEYAAFVFMAELKMKAVYSSKALILNYMALHLTIR
jgi:hypothetical protein